MKGTARLTMFLALMTAFCSCEKEEIITETELPATSREFVRTHFPDAGISLIIRETETFSSDYTVYLTNGFEIDFTKSGDWDDVDGKYTAIPESILNLLPQGIPEYVKNTLKDCHIVEVNKEHYGYEIELSNRMELKFNSKGEFIRIDD
ncbi:MAG: PepSY-like domain-containing protein [Prevotellaceae bacterium]|jgi:hypothetical protein|nr:PepSY-like domain-containing protein [Prevotellaceae bacterium]